MRGANTGSFKLKLVSYFLLLSLVPAAATFWGFTAVAKESETRRVEARMQAGLRAALVAYADELERAAGAAAVLANDARFQSALARGDRTGVLSMLPDTQRLRVESRRFRAGRRPPLAAERRVVVVGPHGALGSVVASVPLDNALLRRLQQRSGLTPAERVVFVADGRIVVAPDRLTGAVGGSAGRTTRLEIAGERYLALVADESANAPATLGVLAPQAQIDAATATLHRRLVLGIAAAILLIALVAYFEGRSIVRAVSRIAHAANAIARGKLDERVPVKGRDELARLANVFNQMAEQLQARVHELESERGRLRAALGLFGQALGATHQPDQLMRVVVETAVEATGAHGGMLVAADGTVVEVGTPGTGADRIEIPLLAGRVGFGTLFLFGRRFDAEARETAISLVGQAVLALENARLHRIVEDQAFLDGLTGLANRRRCEEALDAELARVARFGGVLAVVMADLDNFKSVNDEHGHPVGDTVLRAFAAVLEDTVRGVDVAGRWGGEEFLLVLPETDLDGAALLAERIRERLEETVLLTPEGVPLVVTASFGVAEYEEGESREALVASADGALYAAKRAGKNRVVRTYERTADRTS